MEMKKEDPYQWLFKRLLKLNDSNVILAGLLGSAKQSAAASPPPIVQNAEELLLKAGCPALLATFSSV